MIEIDEYIVSTITEDATMISLMGIDANDQRVYAWYPSFDVVYTAVYHAALIYRKASGSRPGEFYSYPSQIPNINYHFRVLSKSQLVLGQVAERLIDLFDEKYNVLLTNFGIKKISVIGNSDAPTEGDAGNPIYVKTVSFSFSNVVKRS
jgi:hypothetical protein